MEGDAISSKTITLMSAILQSSHPIRYIFTFSRGRGGMFGARGNQSKWNQSSKNTSQPQVLSKAQKNKER